MAINGYKLKVIPNADGSCSVKIYSSWEFTKRSTKGSNWFFEFEEEKKLKNIKSAVSWVNRIAKVYANNFAGYPVYVTDSDDKVAYFYIIGEGDATPRLVTPKKATYLK